MFYLHLMRKQSEAQRSKPRKVAAWWGQRSLCCTPQEVLTALWEGGVQERVDMPLTCLSLPIPTEERRAREWPLDVVELPEGHLEDWLEKRAKRLSSAPSSRYRTCGSPPPIPSGRVP